MANFDPNTGAPLAPQKKRGGRTALIIICVVLLCALGFGFGASVRALSRVRIVPRDGSAAPGNLVLIVKNCVLSDYQNCASSTQLPARRLESSALEGSARLLPGSSMRSA